jgi:predicted 3-demethylubiquinone-9 3-methyltransferase (glyoxalase superfamily)
MVPPGKSSCWIDGYSTREICRNCNETWTLLQLSHGISLCARCETQEEIDHLRARLGEGGAIEACGWLKDKFSVSWQIIPEELENLLSDSDKEKSQWVSVALLKMKKLDLEGLRNAHAGTAKEFVKS